VWTSFVGAQQRLVHHLPYSVCPRACSPYSKARKIHRF
jgi:hypothetical protein